MPVFRTRSEPEPRPASAEDLFRTLRPPDPGVRHLWSHQADIIRLYHELPAHERDVALELPTGAGKTLVGLLLAEFRRRALGHRVLYVCPTSQLASQVGERAAEYGMDTVTMTGPQRDYPRAEYTEYSRARVVAITNYSSIFNSNPRLNDGQTLVFDDAHAAEGPVAGAWSLSAQRDTPLYGALLPIVGAGLPEGLRDRIADDNLDPVSRGQVEICGPHDLSARVDQLRDALAVQSDERQQYPARMLADALPYCLAYVSWREILLRPFVAPTRWHPAFATAIQRIYMSATLGSAGELERAFGVPRITRLPVPRGWEEQGAGRRFFLFPTAALNSPDVDELVRNAITQAGRALVLAPSGAEIEAIVERCLPQGATVTTTEDLAAGRPFGDPSPSVLILANRYDGIDLPDDACRLIVLSGLPSGSHLQERFLWERLGAKRVLAERIRTRVTQGAGRCTRNVQDFAAVIIRGEALTDFLSRSENTTPMQSEFQAELQFGLDNSDDPEADLAAMLASFWHQDADWLKGDADIESRIPILPKVAPIDSEKLAQSAAAEVECWQEVWHHDVPAAIASARRASDLLEGGAEIRPYRAFWLYLAASLALASASSPEEHERANAMRDDALACARSIAWRPRLGTYDQPGHYSDTVSARAAAAAANLMRLGIRGTRFERHLRTALESIRAREAAAFERGLETLGALLGFESLRPSGQAAPDGAWRDDRYILLFEAKTEERSDNPISVSEVRQAQSHREWMTTNAGWVEPASAYTFVVSSKSHADATAKSIAEGLLHLRQDAVADLAEDAATAARIVRGAAPGMSDGEIANRFEAEFRALGLDSDSLVLRLIETPIARMPVL